MHLWLVIALSALTFNCFAYTTFLSSNGAYTGSRLYTSTSPNGTCAAAGVASPGFFTGQAQYTASGTYPTTNEFSCIKTAGGTNGFGFVDCGSNSAWNYTTHTCVYTTCPAAGTDVTAETLPGGTAYLGSSTASTKTYCNSGCNVVATFTKVQASINPTMPGYYGSGGTAAFTGTSCGGDTSPSAPAPATTTTCTSSQTLVKVNGVNTCVNNTTNKIDSVVSPTGGTQTTTNSTATNGDGSKTVTTTITNNVTGAVTTITSNYASGVTPPTLPSSTTQPLSTTGSGLGDDPKASECSTHPETLACVVNSVSGGTSCNSPPSCSGDQALCAVVYQTYETRCLLDPQDPADKSAIDQALTDYNTAVDAHKDQIEEQGAKGQDAGGIWSWSFVPSIPTATCTDPSIGSGSRSLTWTGMCAKLDMVRDLFGWAFYLITGWALFGVMTGKKGED